MRDPAEITQASAAHIAKCRIAEILKTDQSLGTMKRIGLQMGLKSGVDEIAEILYAMGLRLSIDKNNPIHQQWIADESVELEVE